MCKANPDCEVKGRREMVGRKCEVCKFVLASCSNCGNEWSYDSRLPSPNKCPECGKA